MRIFQICYQRVDKVETPDLSHHEHSSTLVLPILGLTYIPGHSFKLLFYALKEVEGSSNSGKK